MLQIKNTAQSKPEAPPLSRKARNAGDVCPISRIPVSVLGNEAYHAKDGYIYDKESLAHWLNISKVSPITRQPLLADHKVLLRPAQWVLYSDFMEQHHLKIALFSCFAAAVASGAECLPSDRSRGLDIGVIAISYSVALFLSCSVLVNGALRHVAGIQVIDFRRDFEVAFRW